MLAVVDDYTEQSYAHNEKNKIFISTDEKHQELAKQIREKSESLIHFIESVSKSLPSYQSNEK